MFSIKRAILTVTVAGSCVFLQPAFAEDITVNDAVLTYTSEGSGDPVLFLHGAITDMRAWEDYRARISEDRRFIAYTQRLF